MMQPCIKQNNMYIHIMLSAQNYLWVLKLGQVGGPEAKNQKRHLDGFFSLNHTKS